MVFVIISRVKVGQVIVRGQFERPISDEAETVVVDLGVFNFQKLSLECVSVESHCLGEGKVVQLGECVPNASPEWVKAGVSGVEELIRVLAAESNIVGQHW